MTPPAQRAFPVMEWPTMILAVVIYAGWVLATLFHALIPLPILFVIGAWLTAWHGSLQHEIIHGHPTRWGWLNTAIAFPPLSLWLPYEIYRRSHVVHHVMENLTDPRLDPESRYTLPAKGLRGWWWTHVSGGMQSNLLGRLILGPITDAAEFLAGEIAHIARGDWERLGVWAAHLAGVAAIVAWLHFVCAMSFGQYLLCFVYPGAALSLIRSFAEHRAHPDPRQRTAIVERAPVLGLLFLHNNLHVIHHERPGATWYELPALYRRERARILQTNGGLVYNGYADVFRRFLLRPHDEVSHPAAMAARR